MIPLIRDFCSIIKISISDSILQILNSYESQKPKEQTYYGILYCMGFLFKTLFLNSVPYICLGNSIWVIFIFNMSISNIQYLLGYIRKILYFGLNGIQNTRIFRFSKILSYLSIFLLLFIINIAFFEKLYKRKQQSSLLKEVAKFLKNPKNYPIVPLLWLNDNEIICNVGLGCENESIDQGRSYVNDCASIVVQVE